MKKATKNLGLEDTLFPYVSLINWLHMTPMDFSPILINAQVPGHKSVGGFRLDAMKQMCCIAHFQMFI